MQVHNGFDNGEPQAGAGCGTRPGCLNSIETVEELWQVLGRNSAPGILYQNFGSIEFRSDMNVDASLRRSVL